MRKIIFMAALCLVTINISAQNVYKEILRLSKVGTADKTKDLDTRRVYQFKVDELNYMLMKTREQKPDTKMSTIDRQAYAMYDFVNSFITVLSKTKNKKKKQLIISIYKEATINNPLFKDNDKELVLSYYNREDYLIQFSLDTDWLKAREEVKKKMDKL